MENDFVPYLQSLALKELRFDEPCMRGWDKNGKIWYHPDSDIILDDPTFSQAFRFFREKYNFYVIIKPSINNDFTCVLWTSKAQYYIGVFPSYEEAELECLVKLIDIVKKQNLKG